MRRSIGQLAALTLALAAFLGPASSAWAATQPARLAVGVTGAATQHTVRGGESLASIGARYGVAQSVLVRDNALKPPYRLRPGDALSVYHVHLVPEALPDGILINLPQRMLFHFESGTLQAAYPIAIGRRDWKTPTGNFHVVDMEQHKTWCVPPSIQEEMRRAGKPVLTRVPPGSENPLGDYWIGLSIPGYGIHGTNAPSSIYRVTTHGCMRMHPDDIQALYRRVKIGTPVVIVYEPVLLARAGDGRIMAEVDPDVYNRAGDASMALRSGARAANLDGGIDWTAAAAAARSKQGVARDITAPGGER
jgi:L,D-transpeptidase ErfK/SrfK